MKVFLKGGSSLVVDINSGEAVYEKVRERFIIADMVKLPVTLTTYVTRHSWATIAKSKNVPINVISDALGHDSIATTQIYLASIDTSVIDRANEMIIKDL